MKDYDKLEKGYDIFNKYIDEAISLVLKNRTHDCIRVLESLKLFSSSLLSMDLLFDHDDEDGDED